MKLMKREEQKKEDTWALEDLYINDDAWKSDGVRLQFAIDGLKEYDGKLQDSADELLECLKAYADANCLLESYYVYANERYHQDTANSYYQGFAGEAEIKMNLLQAAASYMVPQILGKNWRSFIKKSRSFQSTVYLLRIYRGRRRIPWMRKGKQC